MNNRYRLLAATAVAALLCAPAAAARHAAPRKKSAKPPLGWSSWYAFGGCGQVNQTKMEQTFEKLVNRSVVPGSNKSLHDVGYQFANLDDGVSSRRPRPRTRPSVLAHCRQGRCGKPCLLPPRASPTLP